MVDGRWRVRAREVDEAIPGPRWSEHFASSWPAYRQWLERSRWPSADSLGAARRRLRTDLPELWPTYERLVGLAAPGGALAERFLTLWQPPPFLAGCSVLASRCQEPVLARSYDFAPWLWEGRFWNSGWSGRRVLASLDCLWGAVDGMNRDGLAVALAFGGRRVVGEGYGITLLVRWLLEACSSVAECREALSGMRSHMAYSLLMVDRGGTALVAELAPDRRPVFREADALANHQALVDWPEYVATSASRERLERLEELARRHRSLEEIVEAFQQPPLLRSAFSRGSGTLYTALYRVARGTVELLWPSGSTTLDIDAPRSEEMVVEYGERGVAPGGADEEWLPAPRAALR